MQNQQTREIIRAWKMSQTDPTKTWVSYSISPGMWANTWDLNSTSSHLAASVLSPLTDCTTGGGCDPCMGGQGWLPGPNCPGPPGPNWLGPAIVPGCPFPSGCSWGWPGVGSMGLIPPGCGGVCRRAAPTKSLSSSALFTAHLQFVT